MISEFKAYNAVDCDMDADAKLDEIHLQFYYGKGPNTAHPLTSDKEVSFEISDFEHLCKEMSKRSNFCNVTAYEFHKGRCEEGKTPFLLRHDVDGDLDTALDMARIEAKYGLKATFYILPAALYYSDWYSVRSDGARQYEADVINRNPSMLKFYKELQDLGHEVGLHFFPYGAYNELLMDGVEHLKEEVEWLRSGGLNIVGGVGHASAAAHGADMAEIFEEFANPAINIKYRNNIRREKEVEFKGITMPRFELPFDELGFEYIHEFSPIMTGYWAIRENGGVRYAATLGQLPEPEDFCTIDLALRKIDSRIKGEGFPINGVTWMIHPVHMQSRISKVRQDERSVRDELAPLFNSEILEKCPSDRAKNAPGVYKYIDDDGLEREIAHFTNKLGFLDYEADYAKDRERFKVMFLGGALFEGAHLQVAQQLQAWLKKACWHDKRKKIAVRKFAATVFKTDYLMSCVEADVAECIPDVLVVEVSDAFLAQHSLEDLTKVIDLLNQEGVALIPIVFTDIEDNEVLQPFLHYLNQSKMRNLGSVDFTDIVNYAGYPNAIHITHSQNFLDLSRIISGMIETAQITIK